MELKLLGILFTVIGIIYISYKIPVRMGFKKTGIWLSIIITILIISPIFSYILEDYLFFKSDVKEYFQDNELTIENDFQIESNDITGLTDYYQEFKIELSENDKQNLIRQIVESDYFIDYPGEMYDIRLDKNKSSDSNERYYAAYESDNQYEFQSFLKRNGYTPRWDMLIIPKKGNIITCSRIED